MQITIVQVEIEEAIRNHILSLIDVRDGKRIDITLKATRGDEGATAIINIVDADTSGPKASFQIPAVVPQEVAVEAQADPKLVQSTEGETTVADAAVKARKPLGRPSKAAIAAREAEAVAEAQETPAAETHPEDVYQEEAVEPELTEEEQLANEAAATEPVEQEIIPAEPEVEAAPAPRPSLFSGLNKPKN